MSDVFIIGAGCSVPYGFPTGAMLMQKLKDFQYGGENLNRRRFAPLKYIFDVYQESLDSYATYETARGVENGSAYVYQKEQFALDKVQSIVAPFAKSIRHSMMVSTDEFLKNRLNQEKSEEADFGKRLIAREILVSERESEKQFSYEDGKRISKKYWLGNIDWIQHFLSRIDQQSNWEEILKQTVFLTFNYDRVLEYCIFLYLTSDKQYADADAHSFIDEMQIYHVNGYIGSLKEIPFGVVENGMYQEIAKRMATVWEKRSNPDGSEKEKYQEFLRKAQRVYFMGFSYIPDNLESIGINRRAEIIRDAEVYATAMGLSSQNRLRISSYLDLKDFEKRNEPEPMPEIKIQRKPSMTAFGATQEYKQKEISAIEQAKKRRKHFENRILKDASAVDLILDYYTF